MVRQQYYTEPSKKNLEVYYDFSAGLNTVTANDNMTDNELTDIMNMDIVERGSLRRRGGMVRHITSPVSGNAQGYFRFYKNETEFDEIIAVSGKLYKNGEILPIEGLTDGFQIIKPIEAVQFQNKLWIATGTKLVEYDGTTAKVVEPYKPQPLEALYIGTNGLADDPDNYMQNGEALTMRIDGVTFSSRYGVVNQEVTLTAYISKPADRLVEFQFEWRSTFMEEGKWLLGQDWSESPVYVFKTDAEGDVQFRVNLREKGLTVAETQYLVPKYKVKPTTDPNDVPVNTDYIHKCNRILLHWNRLVMYGDSTQPDAIYVSHLNTPNYFPVPNSLRFENGRNEKITSLVQYRDMIVAFTPTTIQALFGKSPFDFKRVTLNTSIGCVAPYSAVVLNNYIVFLSLEGVHILKSVGYVNDKANVEKVDTKIDNIVPKDSNAVGLIHEGQYHLVFPSKKMRLRLKISNWSWVKDTSERLDFVGVYGIDGKMYGQQVNGNVLKFDPNVWDDDGFVYEDMFATRYFNFGTPNHSKKLKETQLLIAPSGKDITATITVYADSDKALNPDTSRAIINDQGEVDWVTSSTPNITIYGGTELGAWTMGDDPFGDVEYILKKLPVSGKCRASKLVFSHQEPNPCHILGLGYIFKMKRA